MKHEQATVNNNDTSEGEVETESLPVEGHRRAFLKGGEWRPDTIVSAAGCCDVSLIVSLKLTNIENHDWSSACSMNAGYDKCDL